MRDWIDTLKAHGDSGSPVVLVTVIGAKGSVPRRVGTRMIVSAATSDGTIGGGELEHRAIAIARSMLSPGDETSGSQRFPQRFPLGASAGQSCGGVALLLFERVSPGARWLEALVRVRATGACALVTPLRGAEADDPIIVTAGEGDCVGGLGEVAYEAEIQDVARAMLQGGDAPCVVSPTARGDVELFVDIVRPDDFHIVLFGAGHVGRALVNALAPIRCRVTWVDAREAEFPATLPNHVERVITDAPEAHVDAAPAGAYFLVMTHSHPQDESLTERILLRDDFAYFGLIGSVSKRRQFEKRLEARGMQRERFGALTCPIGIAGITGKEPEVIAIAVVAQLLQVRSARAAEASERDSRCA